MSEQDDQDPAAPGPRRRRRSGHFDPKEEVPFADGIEPDMLFGKKGGGSSGGHFDPNAEVPFAEGTDPEALLGKARGSEQDGKDDLPDFGPDEDPADRWDVDDPRRQKDQMAPPRDPCECYCLHCGRTFMSDQMWFQKVIGSKDGFPGFWMCPTPNCSGAGFTFDIFPTDPTHPANAGWVYDDGEEEGEWDEETGDFLPAGDSGDAEAESDYDPDEPKYKELDEMWGDRVDDDDLEGEEWKYGLQPGERPESPMSEEARREQEEEERLYDSPDERPRELDWTNREDPPRPPKGESSQGTWADDDDIPF
jgi:hypothetical protein